ELSRAMGVFIPLIVVNCIIMGRVEAFSYKRTVAESAVDALGMGIGYTWVLSAISVIRELLGTGKLLGNEIFPEAYAVGFFSQSAGGFLVFGLLIAVGFALKGAFYGKEGSR
ncbi:MAG TPA: Rnf-Nqr domain containing protein, partial [Treponemataceae bacterium]|nr:Rnf-Nqr domain containing protein [Treponemataceae bacterium]